MAAQLCIVCILAWAAMLLGVLIMGSLSKWLREL